MIAKEFKTEPEIDNLGALEERDTKVTSPGCRYITKPVALHVSYQDSLKQSVLFGW